MLLTSVLTSGNISKRQARPPNRLAWPRFNLRALDPHRTNCSFLFSINPWTSSRICGTFCTSSKMIGCFRTALSCASNRSRKSAGRLERLQNQIGIEEIEDQTPRKLFFQIGRFSGFSCAPKKRRLAWGQWHFENSFDRFHIRTLLQKKPTNMEFNPNK